MLGSLSYQLNRQLLRMKGNAVSHIRKPKPVDYPIDFVVTWVDEHDEEWLAEKNRYLIQAGREVQSNNQEERYRDWDLFRYWFRGVEKYAPWVRKVYLVTCGHVPSWLNREAEKLVVVSHAEFIPEKYLPTFSCNPIELNLHRIPGLSEHFVYFNDDMYLTAPVYPEDFFDGEYPRCAAIAQPLRNDFLNDSFYHQQFSCLGVFNGFWKGKISSTIRNYPDKWFDRRYGVFSKYNMTAFDDDYLLGLYFSHLAVPFCKRSFEMVWHDVPKKMDETSMNRFRTPQDLIHQIVTLWDLPQGRFSPLERGYYGRVFADIPEQIDEIRDAILKGRHKMVCLNDSYLIEKDTFNRSKSSVCSIMDIAFPKKSVFES